MMEARWKKAQQPDADPLEQIRQLVAAQLCLIQSTPAIPAILFSRELHTKNKGLRKAFFDLLSRFHSLMTRLALQAYREGRLRKDLDPADVAYLVIGLIQGLAVRWSISGRCFDLVKEGERLLIVQLNALVVDQEVEKKRGQS